MQTYILFSLFSLSVFSFNAYSSQETPIQNVSTQNDILPLLGFFTEHYILMTWLFCILIVLVILLGTMFIGLKRNISFFEVWFNGYTPRFLKRRKKEQKHNENRN